MSRETDDMDQMFEDMGRLLLSLVVCAVLLGGTLVGLMLT